MGRTEFKRIAANLDPDGDAELITDLESMLRDSPFRTEGTLIKAILEVAIPVLKEHPMFNTKIAIQLLRQSIGTPQPQASNGATPPPAPAMPDSPPDWNY